MVDLPVAYCASSFGIFKITGDEEGIQSIQLTPKKILPVQVVPAPLKEAVRQLTQYFNGRRKEFDLKLNFGDAPVFHQEVWQELKTIPYGHTTSYSAIASTLGDANKMRAVGQANRNNPIPIVVPCHRVIAKSGKLQGYYYGLEMKRKLLELENPMSFASQGSLF